ncbi:MAG TPA: hypothetical protein VF530_10445 [Planctomycetota bacterium]
MLARVPRPSGRVLAVALGLGLAAHVLVAAGSLRERELQPGELAQNVAWLIAALCVALLGRLALAFFPPGEPGGHLPRELPETTATSLALGWLALCVAAAPLALLLAFLADRNSELARWLPYALGLGLVAVLALVRWATLPGAMVPRHAVAQESFGRAGPLLLLIVLAWLAHAAYTRSFVVALVWLALGVLLERGLWRARRSARGRALFLVAFLAPATPWSGGASRLFGLTEELALAAALGAGAASLVPWLRRADRRAGLLAGVFLAAPLLVTRDPLAWVGLTVLVGAAHPRQRPFLLKAAGVCALAFVWIGWMWSGPARGRALQMDELVRLALLREDWALAWPLVLLAVLLGVWSFPWRPATWTPGTIEAPRREVVAVASLVGLAGATLALPLSPWFEGQALLILFPPLALLAGLLALPPERPAK